MGKRFCVCWYNKEIKDSVSEDFDTLEEAKAQADNIAVNDIYEDIEVYDRLLNKIVYVKL